VVRCRQLVYQLKLKRATPPIAASTLCLLAVAATDYV